MKKRGLITTLLVAAIGIAAVFGVHWLRSSRADGSTAAASAKTVAASRPLPVSIVRIELSESYQQVRDYTGMIVAGRTSEIGFELGGTLESLLIDEGDRVTAGQVVGNLDTRELVVDQESARSQLKAALAQLKLLERGPRKETIAAARALVRSQKSLLKRQSRDLERRSELLPDRAVSEAIVDQSRFGAEAVAAEVDAAQARLDELEAGTRAEEIEMQKAVVEQLTAAYHAIRVQIENSELKVPFAGTVTKRYLDEGSVVSMGAPVLRLVEDTQLEAQVGVPVDLAYQLETGATYSISCGSRSYLGTLRSVLPEINRQTQTRLAILDLDVNESRPAVGEIARIQLAREIDGRGFWLPVTAIQRSQRGLWSAYVVEQDPDNQSIVKRRDVEVLHTEEDRVYARGTIQPGERVVSAGLHRLAPEQLVNVVNDADTVGDEIEVQRVSQLPEE